MTFLLVSRKGNAKATIGTITIGLDQVKYIVKLKTSYEKTSNQINRTMIRKRIGDIKFVVVVKVNYPVTFQPVTVLVINEKYEKLDSHPMYYRIPYE